MNIGTIANGNALIEKDNEYNLESTDTEIEQSFTSEFAELNDVFIAYNSSGQY